MTHYVWRKEGTMHCYGWMEDFEVSFSTICGIKMFTVVEYVHTKLILGKLYWCFHGARCFCKDLHTKMQNSYGAQQPTCANKCSYLCNCLHSFDKNQTLIEHFCNCIWVLTCRAVFFLGSFVLSKVSIPLYTYLRPNTSHTR